MMSSLARNGPEPRSWGSHAWAPPATMVFAGLASARRMAASISERRSSLERVLPAHWSTVLPRAGLEALSVSEGEGEAVVLPEEEEGVGGEEERRVEDIGVAVAGGDDEGGRRPFFSRHGGGERVNSEW